MNSNRFSFTKSLLEHLPVPSRGERATYHDTHKESAGLQLRVTASTKAFFIQKRIAGRPQRVTLGQFPDMTVEQARKQAAIVKADIAAGKNPAEAARAKRAEMTLQDLFDEYMNRKAAFNKRPDKPKDTYRLYLSPWSNRKLSSIKAHEVQSLHAKIGREKGQVTANIVLKLLHVTFNKAIHEWRIWQGDNPAHGIKKFPELSRERFLQSDELPRFFDALAREENGTIRDYFLLSLLTGARKSNVLAMKWEHINFERAEWRIPETKNGTPQTVTLGQEAIAILLARRDCDPTWVFPGIGATGHLVEPKKAWTRILNRASIADLRIHDLRRTLGSWQAKTGASLSIIGKSLNHKNTSSTAIYARLDLDPVRESVERATDAMLAAGGGETQSRRCEFHSQGWVILPKQAIPTATAGKKGISTEKERRYRLKLIAGAKFESKGLPECRRAKAIGMSLRMAAQTVAFPFLTLAIQPGERRPGRWSEKTGGLG